MSRELAIGQAYDPMDIPESYAKYAQYILAMMEGNVEKAEQYFNEFRDCRKLEAK